jgi:5'-phosphate synthase pdxT subunit
MTVIGVLALQGDFREHITTLQRIGVDALEVRQAHQLTRLDGLIIPGGESTTIGKLAVDFQLMEPLRDFGKTKAMWGTCAGAIFLSRDAKRHQPLLGIMDIQVARNAFGRQIASFEVDLSIAALANSHAENPPYHAVFIRAPLIESVGKDVEILSRLDNGMVVAARQKNLLATSFHPELTLDDRFHRYFVEMSK